jgi:hypothetical protein
MQVKDGVLLYQDGGEVALWGVNYYPQSWHQFDNMKRLGVDMKKAIRDDLDDMRRMDVEVIRIHVFDREISDAAGNLLDNEHLDLLDYLISEASRRGIYFMFTPIAWWPGPNENPDSFSARCPKEYMFCDEAAIRAQARYLANWLGHVNRYTGKRYQDEPAICALEIMNEPAYPDYATMTNPAASYYTFDLKKAAPFKEALHEKWLNWCTAHTIEPLPRSFPRFRYELMTNYLRTMHRAIRSADAKQPVAAALCETGGRDDLIDAIADSPCEAITTGLYAGDWNKAADGVNLLPWTDNKDLDARLHKKARLIYEYDGIKTLDSYFYPACARHFRHYGAQICCMFQYDSRTTAEWNTDWDAHYLNLLFTPNKAVSFCIGGKVFHNLPRGATFPTEGATQSFGNCVVSFDRNISLYADDSSYLNSAPFKGWQPLPAPEKPVLIMGVGDSPYADYCGSGIYTLKIDYAKHSAGLLVNPDARLVGDPWHPDPRKSAVVLRDEPHRFALKIPGLALTRVNRRDGTANRVIEVKDNTFEVSQGLYDLRW